MARPYCTYRIHIENSSTVQIEKYSAEDNEEGSPSGRFGYKGNVRTQIKKLHQAAYKGDLEATSMQELGEKLFEVLLDAELRNDFFTFLLTARQNKASMRIELDVDQSQLPELAALPWEFMRASPKLGYNSFWLSTHPYLVFSRRRDQWAVPDPIQLGEGERLRIVLAVASPGDLPSTEYETIWKMLQSWAQKQNKRVELLDIVNPATRLSLDEMLEQRPHILHFISHGRLKPTSQHGEGQIALVKADHNEAEWLDAEQFSELFTRHQPGVVLLQTCEDRFFTSSTALTNLATYVVQQNIPVVVAMQYEISNASAQSFALEFYKRLARNEPVDKAAQEGRRRIALGPAGYSKRDFAAPVLFMRVKDGRLFRTPAEGTDNPGEGEKPGEPTGQENKYPATVKTIQEALQDTLDRFSTEGIIYQDECDSSNLVLQQLGDFLEELSQKIDPHDYVRAIPLNNAVTQRKELNAALHTFRDICPPSTKYVPGSHYESERDAIRSKLTDLVMSFIELVKRLERANMLQ